MPYTIPETNVKIEHGTRVLIPIYGVHHDAKYYPDPEEFDPERFSEEAKAARPHFTYYPFGEGPRICIGEQIVGAYYPNLIQNLKSKLLISGEFGKRTLK